jgi:hypothetical protein
LSGGRRTDGFSTASDALFRARHRPMLRLVLAIAACAGVALVAVIATWLRTHVVPPDCEDPMTLAQVHRKLTDRLKLPLSVTLDNIRTHAGGYFAFRFACEADLHGINPGELPPGTAIPGSVYYVSQLTEDGQHQEISVRIYPLLTLEKVQ